MNQILTTSLSPATEHNIPELISMENAVAGQVVYSAMETEEEWLHELQTNHVFLIKRGDTIVGNISYEIKGLEHAYISGLMVKPEFQRQGIAREALVQLLELLKEYKRIDLATHPQNPVRSLYDSLGFEIESQKENYFGDGEPRIIMVRKS